MRFQQTLTLASAGVLLCAGCAGGAVGSRPGSAAITDGGRVAAAEADVRAVADAFVDLTLRHRPARAVSAELPGAVLDRLDDRSPAALAALRADEDRLLARLDAIDEPALEGGPMWALHHNLREELEAGAGLRVCREELWDVSHFGGWLVRVRGTGSNMQAGSDSTRAHALRWFHDVPRATAVEIANLREGLRTGYVAAMPIVERTLAIADATLAVPPERSPLGTTARRDTTAGFRDAIVSAVRDSVYPALARYRDFLRDEYLPRARSEVGVYALPDGAACYRAMARRYITLPLDAQEIRARSIAAEQEAIARYVGDLRTRLGRTDPERFAEEMLASPAAVVRSPDEVLAEARAAMAYADARVPAAFSRMPARATVVVLADSVSAAAGIPHRFSHSDESGSRPPRTVLNPWHLVNQPGSRFEIPSIVLHEGWPGHALQIERELERFRSGGVQHPADGMIASAAYVEGWATYAALDLAREFDLIANDTAFLYSQGLRLRSYGVIPLETRLHENIVSRDSLVSLGMREFGADRRVAEDQVDRVTVQPAQIFAYELGRQEILALRRQAEAALGERFDLRQFHEVILEDGALPLPVLRRKVERWIARERGG